DCENADPYCLGATILNLDKTIVKKIKKIILYDDINTSSAWDSISDHLPIPIEKENIKRVVNNKSLTDVTMAVGITKECSCYDIDSAILVSSDSDFWAVIDGNQKINFLVLNEHKKTSDRIINIFNERGIPHCYMDDFAKDKIQKLKSEVLFDGLKKRIDLFNQTGTLETLDVNELIDKIYREAYIQGSESQIEFEKNVFYNKYFKSGFILRPTQENNSLIFKIELTK
ncbi:MAG: hypothetical protein J6C39_06670, partial [Clostridia bacterium]|nr:hypothetical protein [Clostridia bacterium]